ncbi:phosphatidate cytidylyltransferase [Niabella sp. CC-SYL272]|uniref:phosphatidate cytidylyltransferase n=1 Tax=Niabella agricola TaxID=2891571 RepID=UPI001F3DB26D|nr:phosphatidate cytidylyltransferase [Niabella agricola]MCF3111990.1 phosphatidate cytidylyltransferase [Niabella agricola]
MKNLQFYALAGMLLLQSCSAVEAVFKAGMWWAFFLVGIALLGVFLLLRRK